MDGVCVGVQQADGHRLHPCFTYLVYGIADAGLVKWTHYLAGVKDPLTDLEAEMPWHQRLRSPEAPVVQVRTVLPPDQQDVAEALGDHKRGARPLALQQRIGSHRRPVNEEVDGLGGDLEPLDQQPDAVGNGRRGPVGR